MKKMWFPPVLKLLVFWLLISGSCTALQSSVRRAKRLSSPEFNAEIYTKLTKYVVSFRSRTPVKHFGDNHYCGGSIISPVFVLTAASCVMDERKIPHSNRLLQIVAGAPDRLRVLRGNTINIPIREIFVPVNYTLYHTFNIALVKLGFALPSKNPHIGILELPTSPPIPGQQYRVLGWGRMYAGGFLPAKILYIDVMLQTQKTCSSLLENYEPEMLCAGHLDTTIDQNPCPGDTGSPLMDNTTIYGIVIYSLGCGHKQIPSVYTNVWYHLSWIIAITKRNASTLIRNRLLLLLLNVIISLCSNMLY
ncbi:putative trypsin-6 [Drosophila navojoa]|uniref:putative trypsin-6 n=1 Tax=Drosophila navojoa TaxID=7232 RepID=UPI0008477847|nr:putative trypsin-6 [Drosophila navojoa]